MGNWTSLRLVVRAAQQVGRFGAQCARRKGARLTEVDRPWYVGYNHPVRSMPKPQNTARGLAGRMKPG